MSMVNNEQRLIQTQVVSGLILGSLVGVAIGRPNSKLMGGLLGGFVGPMVIVLAGQAGYRSAKLDVKDGTLSGSLHNPVFP